MISDKYDIEKIAELDNYLNYVPYCVNPQGLYDVNSLYLDESGIYHAETCYDHIVYKHYIDTGKHAYSVLESLARCIHDNAILHAMDEFLTNFNPRSVVGIMGGHGLKRTDKTYKDIVLLSKNLTEKGYLMISGGGPGAMEATHLGAWMAGRDNSDIEYVLHKLSIAPTFNDYNWLESALDIIKDYPQTRYKSLGIPTYLYGHEPSTPFATHIAKFFDNSIREDSILTIAFGGIVYTQGSAGTMQEVFQDAVQNHYLSYGFASPMIFYGSHFWSEEMPVYNLLHKLQENGRYANLLLTLTDSIDEITDVLLKFRASSETLPNE